MSALHQALVEPHTDLMRGSRFTTRIILCVGIVVVLAAGWWVYHWFFWQPSPSAVCDHLDEVGAQPFFGSSLEIGGESPPDGNDRQRCEWYYTALRKHQSWSRYGRTARCVMEATENAAVSGCESGPD